MAFTEKYVSALAGGGGNGLTAGTAYTFTEMKNELNAGAPALAGTRYNIKADGTYSRTGNEATGPSGTNTSPIYLRGYKTTIGDGYLGRSGTNGNGPLITTNMPVISYSGGGMYNGTKMVFESLNFTGTNSGDMIFHMGANCYVVACSATNADAGSNAKAAKIGEACIVFECDFSTTAASGPTAYVVVEEGGGIKFDSCRVISSCSTQGGIYAYDNAVFYSCLIKGAAGGAGITVRDSGSNQYVRNCTITAWQDGIIFGQSMDRPSFTGGNMVTDNTRWGLNFTTASCMPSIGPNRTRDNVSGDTNNATQDWLQSGRIIPLVTTDTGGSATDYVNTATDDYNLIAASPGKGVNRPKISDMGAYGLPDPSGGGGAAVFSPFKNFIIRPA